jgi:hypothetical protein
VVGFSSKPLRYIGVLGVLFALTGFGAVIWVVVRKALWNYGIMGWPSLFAAVVVLSGMQLIALSVIGEYIARIYVQAQARPLYNIAERLNFGEETDEQAADELFRASIQPAPLSPRSSRDPKDGGDEQRVLQAKEAG